MRHTGEMYAERARLYVFVRTELERMAKCVDEIEAFSGSTVIFIISSY